MANVPFALISKAHEYWSAARQNTSVITVGDGAGRVPPSHPFHHFPLNRPSSSSASAEPLRAGRYLAAAASSPSMSSPPNTSISLNGSAELGAKKAPSVQSVKVWPEPDVNEPLTY